MDMQVEYFLTSGFSVLLDYADSVCFGSLLNGEGDSFDDSVEMGNEFLWNLEDSRVMLLRDYEGMSFAEGSYVKKSHHTLVFVNQSGRGLFSGYLAKDA